MTVVLAGGAADLAFARFVIEQGRAGKPPALDDLLILHALQGEKLVDQQHVASLIQRAPTEAMAQLERLMQFGWLEARGRGEKRRYLLAGPAWEALGEGTSHPVRASAEELEQREALILDHVRAHGQMLRRLVQQQQLIARGRGRGTYYELPPN